MKRRLSLQLIAFLLACPAMWAQLNCSGAQASKIACLIVNGASPTGYSAASAGIATAAQTPSALSELQGIDNTFAFLNSAVGGEISQIPLASPASALTFTIDKVTGLQQVSADSLGPILTQRAQTVGRHQLFVAATYQYFHLEDVDGNDLKNLPIALPLYPTTTATTNINCPPPPPLLASVNCPAAIAVGFANINLKVNQWVGYASFGLTDRIDASIAVPLLRVDERYTSIAHVYTSLGLASPPPQGTNSGQVPNCSTNVNSCNTIAQETTGIGDIVVASKGILKRFSVGGIAVGTEVRLPTGDAANFLGSGAIGVKPFVSFSYGDKVADRTLVSYRANLGFQFNGNSILGYTTQFHASPNGFGSFASGKIPNRFDYSLGADVRVSSRLTIATDVLGQYVINAPQAFIDHSTVDTALFLGKPNAPPSGNSFTQHVTTVLGSYVHDDLSLGLKLKPIGALVVTGNLLVKLDQGGLRARLVPLFGLSYTFH